MTPVHLALATKNDDAFCKRVFGRFAKLAASVMRQQRDQLREAIVIDVQEVADFYAMADRDKWSWEEHFPNCAPPFRRMAFQFSEPTTQLRSGHMVDIAPKHADRRVMCLVDSDELTDAMRVPAPGHPQHFAEALATAKWRISSSPWAMVNGRMSWGGTTVVALIDASGICRGRFLFAACDPDRRSLLEESAYGSALHVPLLAISFMHCRNIEVVDALELNPSDKACRRMHLPKLTFKRLRIDPMRRVLQYEGQSGEVGIPRALHICRGHFAHYPDGLFNRSPGRPETIWVSQHVRGTPESGMSLKDYEIRPDHS